MHRGSSARTSTPGICSWTRQVRGQTGGLLGLSPTLGHLSLGESVSSVCPSRRLSDDHILPFSVFLCGQGHIRLTYFGQWSEVEPQCCREASDNLYCAPGKQGGYLGVREVRPS